MTPTHTNANLTVADVDAVLLDMDGTLVDSDAAVERVWTDWAHAQGVDPEAVLASCHGGTAEVTVRRFRPDLDDTEVDRHARAHMERETRDLDGVVAATGAVELLGVLDSLALPWAVVTNASQVLARARLGAAGIDPPHLVGVDDVAEGKPAPDGYLAAATTLGVDITRCLVVEDSASGVAAGRAAGARVVGVRGIDADVRLVDLTDLARLLE